MEIRVSEVRQNASGGSYVAKYRAEIELVPDDRDVAIEVVSTIPADADAVLLAETVEAIRRATASVLGPRGLGGRLRLHGLLIHDVDCRPNRFEAATERALRELLEGESAE